MREGVWRGAAHMEPDSAPLMAIETEVSPSTAKVHTVGQAAMRHRRPITLVFRRHSLITGSYQPPIPYTCTYVHSYYA
jgi:hypothetical protein